MSVRVSILIAVLFAGLTTAAGAHALNGGLKQLEQGSQAVHHDVKNVKL